MAMKWDFIFTFAIIVGGYFTTFTMLSGYLLHRIKFSSLDDQTREIYSFLAYLVFVLPTLLVIFFFYMIANFSFQDRLNIYTFYVVVTLLLYLTLKLSPQDKRYYMYFPGLVVFCVIAIFGAVIS